MIQLAVVALGGALGAMARYGVNGLLYPVFNGRFPLSTLVVNVVGSVLMGLFYVAIIEKGILSPEWRNLVMVGFLGAFTTFSTFSLDTLALWQNGHLLLSLTYVLANVVLCILGMALALFLARLF